MCEMYNCIDQAIGKPKASVLHLFVGLDNDEVPTQIFEKSFLMLKAARSMQHVIESPYGCPVNSLLTGIVQG